MPKTCILLFHFSMKFDQSDHQFIETLTQITLWVRQAQRTKLVFIIFPSCVWATVQTKSTWSSSHLVLLMVAERRSFSQFGGRRMSQSKIIWLTDCSSAPQMHLGVSSMPQRDRYVPKRSTQVLSPFSATHRQVRP